MTPTALRSTRSLRTPFRFALVATAAASLVACGGEVDDDTTPGTGTGTVGNAIAVTADGRVVSFDRAAPGTFVTAVALSGAAAGETVVGIDVRPTDGLVYALSSLGRIHVLNPQTGVLTLKSTLAADPTDATSPYTALTGASFGVDFNPTVDRLRIVSDTGLNLRVNVDTGATTTDGTANGAANGAIASAYSNAFAAATTTTLYNLVNNGATLTVQSPPNDGTQVSPLATNLSATGGAGFDIDPRNNTGYAALTVGGATRLYSIALGTGTATAIGPIGGGTTGLVGFALAAPAAPAAIVLTSDNRLIGFNPASPNTLTSNTAVTGLAAGESLLGFDVRPSNGRLYGLTSTGRVVVIDPATGAVSNAVTLGPDPSDASAPFAGINPSVSHAVDFNPVADRLRVISATGANLRINVDTGATITDGTINRVGVVPSVAGAAYTSSFAGAAATTLYDLDAASDVLAAQTPPNDGTLVNVGTALGIDLASTSPIDIASGENGLVLGAFRINAVSGPSSLYTVSLTTGVASPYRNTGAAALSLIGGAGGPTNIVDLAILY